MIYKVIDELVAVEIIENHKRTHIFKQNETLLYIKTIYKRDRKALVCYRNGKTYCAWFLDDSEPVESYLEKL